jgi:asparagine synthase (glutamine-hydrolysing)
MCGFAGFYSKEPESNSRMMPVLAAMGATLYHRGPDSSGEWYDEQLGVGLAHRRLSIQDLSPLGDQPMHSESNRFVIAYNGEIYNFLELKKELILHGCSFRGHSDTEVMLAAFDTWGVRQSLERFVGMFAFSLWDKREKLLILARDRLGEKPLYYGWHNKTFLFGSELKALRKHHDWQNEINRDAITLLLRHNYIPAPHSIFRGIKKLMPGTFLVLNTQTYQEYIETYWSSRDTFKQGLDKPLKESAEDIVNTLEEKLIVAIKGQMIADVPVGAFLSGGIDSSTIVALMQSIGSFPVKTFTIGFHESDHNEAQYAREISKVLGTDHTELYVTPEQALEVIPHLPRIYDEPFADSSQIPTYLVSKLARNSVTVSLSGDGGDELFGGYTHYFRTMNYWRKLKKYPDYLRVAFANILKRVPEPLFDYTLGNILKYLTSRNYYNAGQKIHERADGWMQTSLQFAYQHKISYWKDVSVILGAKEPAYALNNNEIMLEADSLLRSLQYLDSVCYLPDDILTKVDRAAMSNSLETRIPFLDHNIVEYAMCIPEKINILHSSGKWPLRKILGKYIQEELFERPKKGFSVPICLWLRGPLLEWGEDLIGAETLKNQSFFDHELVREKWEKHINGDEDYSFPLWGILMFQSWWKYWQDF